MLIKAAGSRIAEAPQLAVVASEHNFAGASIQAKEKKTRTNRHAAIRNRPRSRSSRGSPKANS